jgi:1-acyl-sn-glycerol-3-phosphate acyltransferase
MKVERDRFDSRVVAVWRFIAQRGILAPVVRSLVDVTVVGHERLADVKGAYVVVANHTSHLDAPLLIGTLPSRLSRYLATGAAADYFFDKWWKKVLTVLFFNAFPIDRSGAVTTSGTAKQLLRRGIPLLVFPEGTRSRDGQIGRYKAGAAAFSSSLDLPLLPVALSGTYEALPRGGSWFIKGRPPIRVEFGEPMHALEGETPSQFMTRAMDVIRAMRDAHAAGADGKESA